MRCVLLAAGLLAALPSFAQLGGAITAGLVTQARGNVAGQAGVGKLQPLKKGQPVRPGMILESEQNSDTVLAFPDGQIGVLGSKGQMRVNNYAYDPRIPAQNDINLNLIEGNLRVVMGEIGQTNPAALRLQVGTASVALLSSSTTVPTDASLVSLGGAVAVTVAEGLLEVRLPNGAVIRVGPGQTLYMNQNGQPQLDTTAKMMDVLRQSPLGTQIQAQLAESRGFSRAVAEAQAVMAPVTAALKNQAGTQLLASAQDPVLRDLLAALILPNDPTAQTSLPAFNIAITPATGAGGGGTPCTASCN